MNAGRRATAAAVFAAAAMVLAACTVGVAGRPATDPNVDQASLPLPPIERPRAAVGFDACELVLRQELDALGGARGKPARNEVFDGSCDYRLASGDGDAFSIGFYASLQRVRSRHPRGDLVTVAGNPSWIYCETEGGHSACGQTVALQPDRGLSVALTKSQAAPALLRRQLSSVLAAVVQRLPPA